MPKMPHNKQSVKNKRLTHEKKPGSGDLEAWVNAFLLDTQARGLSPSTTLFYRERLSGFVSYCGGNGVFDVAVIGPDLIRGFLLMLEGKGRNPGGRHGEYRSLRAFLNWWERETEPAEWKNPLKKIHAPKLIIEPIQGVTLDEVRRMVSTCRSDFYGLRDKAMLLALLDTGARAAEFMRLTREDIDQVGGVVSIKRGKGGKNRFVYLGRSARRALRAYLKKREDDNLLAVWVQKDGEPLALDSLRQVIERRARAAGISPLPSPHDFRRGFAISMLRAGTDIFTLKKLMGHSDLSVLLRYLAILDDDTKAAHVKNSPGDKL